MSDLNTLFEKWEISSNKNINEDTLDTLIKSKIYNYNKIEISNLKYFKYLNYAIEKNIIDTYYNEEIPESLISKVFFDKYYGGRIGFTHGGGSFFILYCFTVVLANIIFKNNELYNISTIYTSYIKAIPVPSFNIVEVSYNQNIITAEIINYKNQVCVRLISRISNKINKF